MSSPNVVPLDTKIDSDPDSKVWVQACSISIERKGIHPAFIPVKTVREIKLRRMHCGSRRCYPKGKAQVGVKPFPNTKSIMHKQIPMWSSHDFGLSEESKPV